jgi:membrane-associated phospholipid phosphatase
VPVGFAYALIGGYARIYVAQHFPLDVGAGIMVAYCSVLLAWVIQIKYFNV